MRFIPTPLPGAYLLELEERRDDRGFFARTFCARELEAHGLDPTVAQANVAVTFRRGTMRGMHYQVPPAEETKLVTCTRGAIYDVMVDLRPDSPTYKQHFGVELSAENRRSVYVPRGFAHGYLSLTDDVEARYHVGQFYSPGHERGFRWDDPAFGIEWPIEPTVVSEKDRSWAPYQEETR